MRFLFIIFTALALAYHLGAQTLKKDDHLADSQVRFDAVRLTAPASVTYWDGHRLEAVSITTDATKRYVFYTDEYSRIDLPKDFDPKQHRKDSYWILYCNKNHAETGDEVIFYAYTLVPVSPSQIIKK